MKNNAKRLLIGLLCLVSLAFSLSFSAAAANDQVQMTTYSCTYDAIRINWEEISAADGYRVYQYIDGSWVTLETISSGNTTTYRISGLDASTEYKFKVKAYTRDSSGTAVWADASATYAASTKSTQVQMTTYSCTYDAVRINWDEISVADGYRVYQYIDGSWVTLETISGSDTTTYRISGLEDGVSYEYKVKAYIRDSSGTAIWQDASEAYVATTKTTQVSLTTYSCTYDAVRINWNEISEADGYRVYQYINGSWVTLETISGSDTTTYRVSGLSPNGEYSFKVKAYIRDSSGTAVWQEASEAYVAYTKTIPVPDQIINVQAVASADEIDLTWDAVEDATAYIVYIHNGTLYVRYEVTTDTSCTVTGLDELSEYKFKVKAYVEESGYTIYGEASDIVTVSTTFEADLSLKMNSATTSSYTIQWSSYAGATSYKLEEYNTTSSTWETVLETTTQFTYSNTIEDGGAVDYRLSVAIVDGGYTVYSQANTLRASTVPIETQILEVSQNSNAGFSIKIEAVSSASGYQIFCYDETTGLWDYLGTTTTTTYNHNSLDSQYYTYRVRAYSKCGSTTYYGDFSEEITTYYSAVSGATSEWEAYEFLDSHGLVGYLYNSSGNYFYTSSDPWQRLFGYDDFYDTAAPYFFMDFDTEIFEFTADGQDWRIQLWKGQYGWFMGCEVGVYTKETGSDKTVWDCASDDDMLYMSVDFYTRAGFAWDRYWDLAFSREYDAYWWCTGFIPGVELNWSDLKMDITITMKSYEMLEGFVDCLEESGFDKASSVNNVGTDQYAVSGLTVYINYVSNN